ncbi:Multidrug resistance efflux pump [hydrothermal vent metagenome]|uniref:Multidrug resistance efflux pump n=1 Tax=hydrothermal vent metagenome TaxID=652676 RepID=A0A1W1BHQ9_9ZZZZ
MIGAMLAGMAYFHPGSRSARIYYITTQIVSNVRGKVIEVPVTPNAPIKKGEILFKIDPTPYQSVVDDLNAQLKFAEQRLKDTKQLAQSAGGSKFDIYNWEKEVASLKAKLVKAEFDLNSTIVKAPSNGYVTHVRVRAGQMAVPIPALPVMTFVNTDTATLIAGFSQEPIQNIKRGDPAEAVFVSVPGRSFQGKVKEVIPALAEGELNANRNMVSFAQQLPAGQVPVIIQLDQNISQLNLPLGVDSVVAVYGAHEGFWSHVAIIRKILLRMMAWSYFLRFH